MRDKKVKTKRQQVEEWLPLFIDSSEGITNQVKGIAKRFGVSERLVWGVWSSKKKQEE